MLAKEWRTAARALELDGGNYTASAKGLGIAINTLKTYLRVGRSGRSPLRDCT